MRASRPGAPLEIALPPALAALTLAHHLRQLGYPWSSPETLILLVVVTFPALSAACLVRSRPALLSLLSSTVLYWRVDLEIASRLQGTLAGLAAAALAFVLLTARRPKSAPALLLAACAVGSFAGPVAGAATLLEPPLGVPPPGRAGLEPIFHFILDEQGSPAALADTIPPGHPAASLLDDYRSRGFEVMSRVTSRSPDTSDSLGRLMSLVDHPANHGRGARSFDNEVLDNAYFKALRDRGYRIQAVQSTFFTFCVEEEGVACSTYARGESGYAMSRFPGAYGARAWIAAKALRAEISNPVSSRSIGLARLGYKVLSELGWPRYIRHIFYSRPAAVLSVIDRAAESLRAPVPGTAYVLHLLLPHFPYMLAPDCSLKPRRDWSVPPRWAESPKPFDVVYSDYWDQVTCVHRRMMRIADAVATSPTGRRAIFVVHGDHGPRIRGHAADEADSVETFVSFRSAGSLAQLNERPLVLQEVVPRRILGAAPGPTAGASR